MRIYVTRKIPGSALGMLREEFDVTLNFEDRILTSDEIKKRAAGADALLSLLTDKIDGEIMDAIGGQLKIIANYAVGFDNIDLAAATARKIYVTHTPYADGGIEPVAEHALALILALAKKLLVSDKYMREGQYQGWEPEPASLGLTQGLQGKTLGIIGSGRIGSHLAEIARGFDLKILYHDIKPNPEIEAQTNATFVPLEQLLRESDFVSLSVPLLPSTHHLIDAGKLSLMKKTAYLVNTSRGPVVNEKALIVALKNGQIAGAGLDVYEFEPRLTEGLTDLPNVVLTPHTASATLEAREKMSEIAAKNIIEALEDRVPPNVVNKEVILKND